MILRVPAPPPLEVIIMIKLQKRHFEYIAIILHDLRSHGVIKEADHLIVCEYVAAYLVPTNPQFDRQKFIDRARGKEN